MRKAMVDVLLASLTESVGVATLFVSLSADLYRWLYAFLSTARSVPTDDVDENKLWFGWSTAMLNVLFLEVELVHCGPGESVSGNLLSVDAGRSFNFG